MQACYINMTDTMTPEQRSRCMSAIKSNDTKPEMLVRKYLHGMGLRYGVHNKKLPGSPDIVLRKYKTVIFINGCFWHGHDNCRYYRLPKSNIEFWQTKINRNRERDKRDIEALRKRGWRVIVVWECELRTKELRQQTLQKLFFSIQQPYDIASSIPAAAAAAEPAAPYGKDMQS